ncbi:hypothetical protein Leryth_016621 [Lithospermum erythrorhizon]|nr:hypothetical protein Leryth_016621 [Lithospermum erythrorhizon]
MAMRPRTSGGASNYTGNRQGGAPIPPVYEDFKPTSEWIQEQESDILLIYLPGFTKESLKVSTEGGNILRVRGERLVTSNKWKRFQEDFQIPEHCNLRGTRARFEGGILTITVPKKTITPPKEESKPTTSTTSQKPPEILPSKLPEAPKNPVSQKVQENIPPKITSPNKKDKDFQESPVSSKVKKEPMSQKVQENMPPKITAPNKKDRDFKESNVSDDKQKDDEAFSKQDKLHKTSDIEQTQNVDSGASKHQETMTHSKARQDHGEMANKVAKPELVERRIQDSEKVEAKRTHFVDEEKAKHAEKMATSSATGHFGVGNYKKAVKSLADLEEERKLLVNMGAAVLVLMALGAYIYHTVKT